MTILFVIFTEFLAAFSIKTPLPENIYGTFVPKELVYELQINIPSSGIPKADLASDVQSSLSKADTALQSGDIPSKTSQLENDSNFVTEVELPIKSATLDSTTNTLYLTL